MADRIEDLRDERGVSAVIGFILIFAILIISLSTYQAVWVPIQNEQVEYDHYQSVKNDMTNVRSAIFEARTTGEPQSVTVKLGTRYPTRVLAVNPPPATGQLETGVRRNITMTHQDGTAIDIPARYPGISNWSEVYTQFLTYTPNYHELDTGAPIQHEHGLLYMNYSKTEQGGGLVLHSREQTLVKTVGDGPNMVTIVPIQGNYSEQGVERVTIEPEPGILVSRQFENINVTVPTELGESTWEEVLSGQLRPEKIVVDEGAETLTLVLDGTWRVRYAPVGVSGPPESGVRGSTETEINPAAPGDVRLVNVERRQEDDEWGFTWENTAGTVNISEARVNFYPGDATTVEYVNDPVANRDVNWNVGGDFQVLEPPIRLPGNGQQTEVTFGFDSVLGNDEWWILTVIFETGEQGMYFISEGGTAIDGGGGCVIGSNTNPGAIQWNNLQGFTADSGGANRWEIGQINVKDADNDDDLSKLKIEITDSEGTVRATWSEQLPGAQYQIKNLKISPDDSGYDIPPGENYTLTATVCDADGNSNTETRQTTSQ
ncbi:MAG: hypothetical protein ABEJ84_02345 [Halodesulfurarchaeum sp.]